MSTRVIEGSDEIQEIMREIMDLYQGGLTAEERIRVNELLTELREVIRRSSRR